MNITVKTLTGTVLDDRVHLSLEEVCAACSVRTDWVVDLVNEGILEPSGDRRTEWKFSGSVLSRVQVARRLQSDLGINLAGIALAIDLLEEIEKMRCRLRGAHRESLNPEWPHR